MRCPHLFVVVPWQQAVDLALLVAADDGYERVGQIGVRIDSVEFTGLDQRSDDTPVCGPCIMASEERVFAVQGDRTDGALDSVIVHLDAAVGKEQA